MNSDRILVPELILDAYHARKFRGEFRAVVMFVDLSGFTPLTTALMAHGTEGAEVIAEVLSQLFGPLVSRVYAQGGFIAGFAGDAFKAVFPTAKSGAAQRAVLAALEIRDLMLERKRVETRFGRFEFDVKICLATGMVQWGVFRGDSGEQRAAAFFEGEALAAALAADPFAEAGEIVFDASTQKATAGWLKSVPVGKGLSRILPDQSSYKPVLPDDDYELKKQRRTALSQAEFFPQSVLDQVLQGEFRQVATVFINLSELPEDAEFYGEMFRMLGEYGGYLCRIGRIGDRDKGGTLLLFWGAPVSHENDVERALAFLEEFKRVCPVPLRAGVTYSLAFAGFVGSAMREEYTCYGSFVNLAARQMVNAPWGEIWLDESAADLASAHNHLESRPPISLKGFANPQVVYSLQARKDLPARSRPRTPMIGRQRELAMLSEKVADLTNQEFTAVISLVGEAGIGKSRLVEALRESLDSGPRPYLWAYGQADDILRLPLNPFKYWLTRYFNQSVDASEAENKVMLETKLSELQAALLSLDASAPFAARAAALAAELKRTQSIIAALLTIDYPDSLYARLDPEARFENTLDSIKRLIQAESMLQPVVIVIEDAHLLDPDSRTLIDLLLRNSAGWPYMLIMTSRSSGTEPTWDPGEQVVEISLDLLDEAEVAQLGAEVLGQPLGPDLLKLVSERSDRNPFFGEQILRYMAEQNLLMPAPDGLKLAQADFSLPIDVRSVLVARLDRLTLQVRQAVQTAAVLGREFELSILMRMLLDERAETYVREAEHAAIWDSLSELRYLFKHGLLKDAAYEMQLRSRRRELHQTAARAIERIHRDHLAPHYSALAYHLEKGDQLDQAMPYLILAGDYADDRFENAAASEHFGRWMKLNDFDTDNPEPPPNFKTRIQPVYEKWLRISTRVGDWENARLGYEFIVQQVEDMDPKAELEARIEMVSFLVARAELGTVKDEFETLDRLADEVGDLHLLGRNAFVRASHLIDQADYEQASRYSSVAQQAFEQANDWTFLGQALTQLSTIAWNLGDFQEALTHLELALEIAQSQQDEGAIANILNTRGITEFRLGENQQARKSLLKALEISRRRGSKLALSRILLNLGNIYTQTGRDREAIGYFQQSLELNQELGRPRGEGMSRANIGLCYSKLGDFRRALDAYQQAHEIFERSGYRAYRALLTGNIGVVHWMQGQFDRAIKFNREGLELDREIGNKEGQARQLCNLGNAYRDAGQLERAEQHYRESISLQETVKAKYHWCQALVELSDLVLKRGELAEAERLNEQASILAVEADRHDVRVKVKVLRARLAAARDDRRLAATILTKAIEVAQDDADLGRYYFVEWQLLQNMASGKLAYDYFFKRVNETDQPFYRDRLRLSQLEPDFGSGV
jgi:class 3 adenylate cyclase/tetratricopeptide (TPR) repeat protein